MFDLSARCSLRVWFCLRFRSLEIQFPLSLFCRWCKPSRACVDAKSNTCTDVVFDTLTGDAVCKESLSAEAAAAIAGSLAAVALVVGGVFGWLYKRKSEANQKKEDDKRKP